jgi:hypothetical protein
MKTTTYTQHEEHKDWLNKLAFYRDETAVMQRRLDEINSKNTANEIRQEIEHFQNQIIVQKNNIDDLQHLVKHEEELIKANIQRNPKKAGRALQTEHLSTGEKVGRFEDNFNSLRKEYNIFLGKRM